MRRCGGHTVETIDSYPSGTRKQPSRPTLLGVAASSRGSVTCPRWRRPRAGLRRSQIGTRRSCGDPVLASAPMGRRALVSVFAAILMPLLPGLARANADGGPGNEQPPETFAPTIHVPAQFPTVQQAVDHVRPGGMVLIAPGVYREEVPVTTPFITIRGEDRDRTIIDGDFQRAYGIQVQDADGVGIQNLTARHALVSGFEWTRVHGYQGSYLTAYADGESGVRAYASDYGEIDHSYASVHPDAGFSIGACDPCHTVITDVESTDNAVAFSGTNAGGDLAIVNSEWHDNFAGIVLDTLDSEPAAPQHDAVIAGNYVHDDGDADAPTKAPSSAAFGIGIAITGGGDNLVAENLVEESSTYGIGVLPTVDTNVWVASDNVVRDNVVRRSGQADLALGAPAGRGGAGTGGGRRLLRQQRRRDEPATRDRAALSVLRTAPVSRRRRLLGADGVRAQFGARRNRPRRPVANTARATATTTDAGRSREGAAGHRGRRPERAAAVHHPPGERDRVRTGPNRAGGDRHHGDAARNVVGRAAGRAVRLRAAVRPVRHMGRRRDVGSDPAGVGATAPPRPLDARGARRAVPGTSALLRVRPVSHPAATAAGADRRRDRRLCGVPGARRADQLIEPDAHPVSRAHFDRVFRRCSCSSSSVMPTRSARARRRARCDRARRHHRPARAAAAQPRPRMPVSVFRSRQLRPQRSLHPCSASGYGTPGRTFDRASAGRGPRGSSSRRTRPEALDAPSRDRRLTVRRAGAPRRRPRGLRARRAGCTPWPPDRPRTAQHAPPSCPERRGSAWHVRRHRPRR